MKISAISFDQAVSDDEGSIYHLLALAFGFSRNRAPDRFCCNAAAGYAEWLVAVSSGGDLQETGNEGGLRPHVPSANVVSLPLPDYRHRLVASKRSPGRSQADEAEARPDQAFDPPVVLLDDVVQVFALPQPREAPQLARSLHVSHRTRVGRVLINRDRHHLPQTGHPAFATEPHRWIKRLVRPGLGFVSLRTARRTLAGYEAMAIIRKGQAHNIGGRDMRAQAAFVAGLLQVAA